MKKIVLSIIMMSLMIPCLSFAAGTVHTLADGTSIDANSNAVSLSPNVELSYNSADGIGYALTGASTKGTVSYGVEAGNPAVYQKTKAVGDGPVAAADDADVSADQYAASWSEVGK